MKAALALVLALAASPVEAKPWQCVLWPRTCQMDQPGEVTPLPLPPVPVEQVPMPLPHPAPAIAPRPGPTPKAAPPAKKVATPKRIKSNFAKPKRKVVTVQASWCARVPSWATLEMIEAAATARGVTMTEAQKSQARACIASKRTS